MRSDTIAAKGFDSDIAITAAPSGAAPPTTTSPANVTPWSASIRAKKRPAFRLGIVTDRAVTGATAHGVEVDRDGAVRSVVPSREMGPQSKPKCSLSK